MKEIELNYKIISAIMQIKHLDFYSAIYYLEIPEFEYDMYHSLILGEETLENVLNSIT